MGSGVGELMELALWTGGGRVGPMVLAIVLDQVLRDPPNAAHPVAWMGRTIGWAKACVRTENRTGRFIMGLAIVLIGGGIAAATGWLILYGLGFVPALAAWLAEAVVLKLVLSMRGLAQAANAVRTALATGDLGKARRLLGWHLVSRRTEELDAPAVAGAAIESVAENTSDSVVAPLFYYTVAGLPGVLAYRFVNTADALLGYRGGAYEWLGKGPARLDDLLNAIPARLTAGLMMLAAILPGTRLRGACRVWWQDRWKTASLNAGQPMSVAAGALGVELIKPGDYVLGAGLREPTSHDVRRAVRLMHVSVAVGVGLTIALVLLWHTV